MQFLGCLFFFIFGIFFVFVAFGRLIFQWAYRQFMKKTFGVDPGKAGMYGRTTSGPQRSNQGYSGMNKQDDAYDSRATHSGDAHHEGHRHGNSRQRRSGKIFAQNEGTYVDFEEVKEQ